MIRNECFEKIEYNSNYITFIIILNIILLIYIIIYRFIINEKLSEIRSINEFSKFYIKIQLIICLFYSINNLIDFLYFVDNFGLLNSLCSCISINAFTYHFLKLNLYCKLFEIIEIINLLCVCKIRLSKRMISSLILNNIFCIYIIYRPQPIMKLVQMLMEIVRTFYYFDCFVINEYITPKSERITLKIKLYYLSCAISSLIIFLLKKMQHCYINDNLILFSILVYYTIVSVIYWLCNLIRNGRDLW